MNCAGNQFLAGPGFTSDQHAFGVTGNAVYHAHEAVHQRAGEDKVRAIDLAGHGVRYIVFCPSALRLVLGTETGLDFSCAAESMATIPAGADFLSRSNVTDNSAVKSFSDLARQRCKDR